ncbi:hypothetical protein C8J57DRAFT_1307458 [Mycena rebaudengoi]|nr:hypothetical protein C8J57DRAFT_1307458 [Mycena rebaudengoi]
MRAGLAAHSPSLAREGDVITHRHALLRAHLRPSSVDGGSPAAFQKFDSSTCRDLSPQKLAQLRQRELKSSPPFCRLGAFYFGFFSSSCFAGVLDCCDLPLHKFALDQAFKIPHRLGASISFSARFGFPTPAVLCKNSVRTRFRRAFWRDVAYLDLTRPSLGRRVCRTIRPACRPQCVHGAWTSFSSLFFVYVPSLVCSYANVTLPSHRDTLCIISAVRS